MVLYRPAIWKKIQIFSELVAMSSGTPLIQFSLRYSPKQCIFCCLLIETWHWWLTMLLKLSVFLFLERKLSVCDCTCLFILHSKNLVKRTHLSPLLLNSHIIRTCTFTRLHLKLQKITNCDQHNLVSLIETWVLNILYLEHASKFPQMQHFSVFILFIFYLLEVIVQSFHIKSSCFLGAWKDFKWFSFEGMEP